MEDSAPPPFQKQKGFSKKIIFCRLLKVFGREKRYGHYKSEHEIERTF